jgi:hypothetical protein
MSWRTYADWLDEAHRTNDRQTDLANELRKCWKDWEADIPYKTWTECIQAEFGMTPGALRERNSYRRRKARKAAEPTAAPEPIEATESESVRIPDGPESEAEIKTEPGPDSARWKPESEAEQDQQPAEPSKPPANPAQVRDRAVKSACSAASRYSEAMRNIPVSEYETYAAGAQRVIAEWTSVRDSLGGRVGDRIEE